MIKSLHLPDSAFIQNLLFFIILVITSNYIVKNILAGNSLYIIAAIISLLLFLVILNRPIIGIMVLPIVAYIIPQEITRLHFASPGMVIGSITLFAAFLHITLGRIRPTISWIWIIILLMIINMALVSAKSGNIWGGHLLNSIQGIVPFLIFSLIVNKESDGRRVLKYWLVAYSCFAILYMLRAMFLGADSIILGIIRIRGTEFGEFNPNTISAVSVLYYSLVTTIALKSNTRREKQIWWFMSCGLSLLILATFSRGSFFGLIMTVGLITFFLYRDLESKKELLIPFFLIGLIFYALWKTSYDLGLVADSRLLIYSSLAPELSKRWDMVTHGWQLINSTSDSWKGLGIDVVGTHSGFTKAALEFGLFYFMLFCIPYIYLVKTSYYVARYHSKSQVRIFGLGIFISGIVAIPQGIFLITLFSGLYAQIFWLFVGYVYLARREVTLMNIKY